ncbi:SWIM-type domain-containing protein [Aphis craccivora]|uniref:SWIM-type domain-containing protein n=1 Tax=Aphis craccivora TaxID=307492 RepID=A0A6G0X3P3_APHCR|nr:SWIM-type domain-containing protein [Aphis craccivora]
MSTKFNNFVQRFEKNYNRKEQWIKFYRLHILYRNHETNNYAEASIRVIKDILLSRTKEYNAVTLVDFIINVGENYFTLRLLDHAHERHSESHRFYSKLCSKIRHIVKNDVKQINNCTYSIPSESNPKVVYIINTEMGICSCKIGCAGAFCKHQAWIHENLKVQLPNLPPITLVERHALGILALGDKCPEAAFFLSLKESLPDTSANNEITEITHMGNDIEQNSNNEIIEPTNSAKTIYFNVSNNTELIAETDAEWLRLQKMIPSLPLIILQKLAKNLKNIKTNQQFTNFIHSVNTSARTINRRGKIRVQPTSISRRKGNVTRGSKRIPAGRRPEHYVVKGNIRRPHNLDQNILKSKPNAKKHGRGH